MFHLKPHTIHFIQFFSHVFAIFGSIFQFIHYLDPFHLWTYFFYYTYKNTSFLKNAFFPIFIIQLKKMAPKCNQNQLITYLCIFCVTIRSNYSIWFGHIIRHDDGCFFRLIFILFAQHTKLLIDSFWFEINNILITTTSTYSTENV